LSFFMTAGHASDDTGAAALLDDPPKAQWSLGDRGHDADGFRDALNAKALDPASQVAGRATSRSDKQAPLSTPQPDRDQGRPSENWRRVATRYDRCPTAFFSAVALAATIIVWQ
jgi:hypothetical protein